MKIKKNQKTKQNKTKFNRPQRRSHRVLVNRRWGRAGTKSNFLKKQKTKNKKQKTKETPHPPFLIPPSQLLTLRHRGLRVGPRQPRCRDRVGMEPLRHAAAIESVRILSLFPKDASLTGPGRSLLGTEAILASPANSSSSANLPAGCRRSNMPVQAKVIC